MRAEESGGRPPLPEWTGPPYDPEFARQMALAEEIMHDDREVLRALAK